MRVADREITLLLRKFADNGFDVVSVYLTLFSNTAKLRSAIVKGGVKDERFMKKAEDITMSSMAADMLDQHNRDVRKGRTRWPKM